MLKKVKKKISNNEDVVSVFRHTKYVIICSLAKFKGCMADTKKKTTKVKNAFIMERKIFIS